MATRIKVKKSEIGDILKRTFPQYKGRKFFVEFAEKVWLHDLNCAGGSINKYIAISVDGEMRAIPQRAPWDNPYEGQTIPLTPEVIIVEHSFFCGHDMGVTIYAHPSHMPRWLHSGQ